MVAFPMTVESCERTGAVVSGMELVCMGNFDRMSYVKEKEFYRLDDRFGIRGEKIYPLVLSAFVTTLDFKSWRSSVSTAVTMATGVLMMARCVW